MANYPLVPWMNPVSPVEPYLQGQATGARIGAELADRAMRQRQMEQQMQLAAQAQAAENARFQQEYALRKAQAEAEIAIRQQTAEQKRAAEATRQQAMMDIQRDIDAGMDEAKAYARHWFKTGESLSGLPQMLREANPENYTPKLMSLGGHDVIYNERTGTSHVLPGQVEPMVIELTDAENNPTGFQAVQTANGIRVLPKTKNNLTLLDKSSIMSRIYNMRKDLETIGPKGSPEYNEALAAIKRLEEDYKLSTTPPPVEKVKVRNKEGKLGLIPKSQLKQALQEGYQLAP